MRGSRCLHWTNGLLCAALLVGSALTFPELPDRVPGHFGAGGTVTRWDEPSALAWFSIPLLALAMAALMYGIARLLPSRPQLFNFPDKERFLALPVTLQAPVVERMREMLYGVSSLMLTLFAVVQWTRFRTAQGADPKAYIALILIVSFLTTPLVLGMWLPRIQRETDRQVKRHREDGDPGEGERGGGRDEEAHRP